MRPLSHRRISVKRVIIALTGVAIALALVLAIWFVPICQTVSLPGRSVSEKERAELENEYRKTLGQLTGGLLVAIGLALTAWRITVSSRDVKAMEDGQITGRFTKAVEMLAATEPSTRIGAIYALGRIAEDSQRDHQMILDILAAFLREQTTWRNEGDRPQAIAEDVQAALTVVCRRPQPTGEGWRLNLRMVNLDGADLSEAHLENALLSPAQLLTVLFRNAHLPGADLKWTDLVGADLSGANLRGALLDGASITGAVCAGADFRETSWCGTRAKTSVFQGAKFDGADFSEGQFQDAHLKGASLRNVRFGQTTDDGMSVFGGVNLEWADLRFCDLQGVTAWRASAGYWKGNNIFGVKNAPVDFRELVLHGGGVEIESDEEWETMRLHAGRLS